ncbi:MAG: hypothetical protein MRECE_11c010 [Mycoplasmataceae bacterium CE_OT135]|nr:MAG: hypothetical protein MRECE_31c009 [Mycoplasmataceae bacterium CE_OT135]KLL03658.1 MAG: hypothetical protein MRECE_11c010 [Mycoplasmataceae bacterium CE_OT135]
MNTKKQNQKNIFLLLTIGLTHALCIFMAAHLDLFRRSEYSFARASNPCYWLWISSWWCVWVGWLTIIWVIYKLSKRAKSSYFEQIFDLTILIANLIMILAFIGNFAIYYLSKKKIEWIYVPDTDNPNRTINLFNSWEIKTQTYYWFNTAISHIFIPSLLLYYFYRFSKVDRLKKNFKLTTIRILVHPSIYFFYVILREKASNRWTHPGKLSYDFPRNYPYPFFYRIMGQQVHEKDVNYSQNPTSRFFWIISVVLIAYVGFSLLSYFLIWLKGKTNYKA